MEETFNLLGVLFMEVSSSSHKAILGHPYLGSTQQFCCDLKAVEGER